MTPVTSLNKEQLPASPVAELFAARRAAMIEIPAGTFRMGAVDGSAAERPIHEVNLERFWLDATPVTNQAYAAFVNASGYQTEVEQSGGAWAFHQGRFQNTPGVCWKTFATEDRQDHPAILVSWNDAVAYCEWVGLRLPTEAEWEKAARGGVDGALYPWGEATPDGTQSNFAADPFGIPGTLRVMQHEPNGRGLFDMVGNVWQWCSDWHGEAFYAQSPGANPVGTRVGHHPRSPRRRLECNSTFSAALRQPRCYAAIADGDEYGFSLRSFVSGGDMRRNQANRKDSWLASMPQPTMAVFIPLGIVLVTVSILFDSKDFSWHSMVETSQLIRNLKFLAIFLAGGIFGMLLSAVARSGLKEGVNDLVRTSALWSGLGLGLIGFSLLTLFVWVGSAWMTDEKKGGFRNFASYVPQHDPGALFAAFMGVVTILGFALTLHDLRELRRRITTFPDLIGRLSKMLDDLEKDEVVQFLAYTPSLGYIALQDKDFNAFSAALRAENNNKPRVDMVCLAEKDLTDWHNLFIGRRTRRKKLTQRDPAGGEQQSETPERPGCVDANLAKLATDEGEYIVDAITRLSKHALENEAYVSRLPFEFQPGYYFFVSPQRALVVVPLQLPFAKGAPSTEDQGNQRPVQMLGFETNDRAIIRDLSDLHESYKRLPSSYVAEENVIIKSSDFPGWCNGSSPKLQATVDRLLRQYRVACGDENNPRGEVEEKLAEDYRAVFNNKLNDTNLEVTIRLALTKKRLLSDYESPATEVESHAAVPEQIKVRAGNSRG